MAAVGRKRTKDLHLPPRMRIRKGRYYYDTQAKPRREIPLGADYGTALVEWAKLEGDGLLPANTAPTFGMAWTKYRKDVLPSKAPRTQADNEKEAALLLKVFKDAPLGLIKPQHIRGYLDTRGKAAKVRANREKALFSHIFNKAREWGYTAAPNPCAGVKGFTEEGRDKYVEDAEFRAVYVWACVPLRNAMDLAYLSAQRPADVLKATRQHAQEGLLKVRQNKTGAKLRIELIGRLGALVERLLHVQPGKVASAYLVRNENEQPLTYDAMTDRFEKARRLSIEAAIADGNTALGESLRSFQFRDLRAKAASDLEDLRAAQGLLGHGQQSTTQGYVRARVGDRVRPVK